MDPFFEIYWIFSHRISQFFREPLENPGSRLR